LAGVKLRTSTVLAAEARAVCGLARRRECVAHVGIDIVYLPGSSVKKQPQATFSPLVVIPGRSVADFAELLKRFKRGAENAPNREGNDDPLNGTLFTVLEEQLGLKLEAAKRPAHVCVVEHVEPPTEN
jgi:uncharacterized protein DUF3738